ncbi:uncharacterized protein TRIADDRAFT_15916, partial [Trichoplax adhaerens]
TLEGHTDQVISLAVSSNGIFLATGSVDKNIRIWDLNSGSLVHVLIGHSEPIHRVHISPDNRMVIGYSYIGEFMKVKSIVVWNLESGKRLYNLKGHTGGHCPLVLTHDRTKVAKVWDMISGDLVATLTGHTNRITTSLVLGDLGEPLLVTASEDHTAKIWNLSNLNSLQEDKKTDFHESNVNFVQISKDGSYVVTGSQDKKFKKWDIETGKLIQEMELLGHTESVQSVVVTSKARLAASGSKDATVRLW